MVLWAVAAIAQEPVTDNVEKNAQFPGGDAALYEWLSKNVRYPATAMEQGIQGRVLVQFVVEKDGSITEVSVMRSPDPLLSKEAERVVKEMPRWNPAEIGGKTVRSRFNLPIMFRFNKPESITIEGRVVNPQGIPIKDAVVTGCKTKQTITTDIDGLFSIKFPIEGDTLVVTKAEMQPFKMTFYSHSKGVAILGADMMAWMPYPQYVKQMESTAKSYYDMGNQFLSGSDGQEQSLVKAFACFRRAANMEYSPAAYTMGQFYDEGIGVEQNYEKAIQCYLKATRTPEARTRLGEMYAEGIGVQKDYKTAARYFNAAVMLGDSIDAKQYLEDLFSKGLASREEVEDDQIYEVVEENAMFPGGDQACYEWLAQHIRYPRIAMEQSIQGRVFVQFVVTKDGSITNVRILRSPDKSLSQEAERLVKSMPNWEPAEQGGRTVNSRFNLPIIFRLD